MSVHPPPIDHDAQHDPPQGLALVAIGASAGGLDASRKLIDALPDPHGMALILVQHLEPNHENLMVDLLASHTRMKVCQAEDGMVLAADHLYIIPPGTYLSVADGALHVSQPQAKHGARLPFDFLLQSLARYCGSRALCVILSGTGADGTLGARAIHAAGGFIVAQTPEEAAYDGMPGSVIATGLVDLVLPVGQIGAALIDHVAGRGAASQSPAVSSDDALCAIVALLRSRTVHDFTHYKHGTLRRRIERRMSLAEIPLGDMAPYLARLEADPAELALLANDLLVNVTRFFRDPAVFDYLAEKILPDLVRGRTPNQALRVWIAGCSTGEETYSFAMLLLAEIEAQMRPVKLQIFASDVDADAIAFAREGLYPDAIVGQIAPARLARYFTHDQHGYRVGADLRAAIVFTVHDVLTDPPFSRIDLVSCRNLLIYLQPVAQVRLIALFHFALREGGILVLGSAETVGPAASRFETLAKAERIYRQIGGRQPGDAGFAAQIDAVTPGPLRAAPTAPSRQVMLADLCQRLILEYFAPAAVLINRRFDCLYSVGPTDRYLHVAAGHPTHDLLAMARPGLRSKLRAVIQRAWDAKIRVLVPGGRLDHGAATQPFSIAAQPVTHQGEDLLLICFLDERQVSLPAPTSTEMPRLAAMQAELDATKAELRGAIHNLELSEEEQKAINEEALSVNEEYQSTNEELLTSKEELQSLNEELTALNSQLQETLERARTTSDDLQNILYSTDVATLFLDAKLEIRFFTPATRAIFNVIPTDIGRPLADLSSVANDAALLDDARTTLRTLQPIEREVEGRNDAWFTRRVMPYRTHDKGVAGVVITFTGITERKRSARALEEAKHAAELANMAKSRFLAAASHDLRQPLQTLALLQGLLSKTVTGEPAERLVALLDPTLGAMTGMLNALLDINQIDAGNVKAECVDFAIGTLLATLRDEFVYNAESHGLALRMVPCSLHVRSDPRLLEQILRNLISNALKYTRHGRVLVGCRRIKNQVRIEVWDTGIGIAGDQLEAIFDEYHQIDNDARDRSRGLGLGLSIVQRLAMLLGHPVAVRSRAGSGSVFSITIDRVKLQGDAAATAGPPSANAPSPPAGDTTGRIGAVLVIEDDPELLDLLELMLSEEGHHVLAVPDGARALAVMARGRFTPDLILADFNLPGGMNGLHVAARLRAARRAAIPVIVLTGDISTETLREIARRDCVQLNKPVKAHELAAAVQRLLPPPVQQNPASPSPPPQRRHDDTTPTTLIYVVDDDRHIREGLYRLLQSNGFEVATYDSAETFLAAYHPKPSACLLIDAGLPGMQGLDVLRNLQKSGDTLPAIVITGRGDVHMAVQAMRVGACDFIEKPVSRADLLASIARALHQARDSDTLATWRAEAAAHIAELTTRQREILDLVLAGAPSKNIAADLGISQRTVENHRAAIMKKTQARSLPALARLAMAAAAHEGVA